MTTLRHRPRAAVVWLGVAVATSVLLVASGATGGSPLRVLDPFLMAAALAMVVRARRHPAPLRPRTPARAVALCAALAWCAGMVYEATLSADGTGFGGMHDDTTTSFLLAQGWYVPAAIAMPLLVRTLRLDLDRALAVGACLAAWEVALTAGPLLVSPAAPAGLLVAAYISAVYAAIVCAGLLLVDPARLHPSGGRPASRRRAAGIGLATGAGLWALFMGWAALLDAAGLATL